MKVNRGTDSPTGFQESRYWPTTNMSAREVKLKLGTLGKATIQLTKVEPVPRISKVSMFVKYESARKNLQSHLGHRI